MAEAEARDERSTRRAYTFGTNQRQLRASIHGRFPMGMRAEQPTARIRGSTTLAKRRKRKRKRRRGEFKMQDPMRIDRSDRVERRRDRRGGNLTTEAGGSGSEVQGRGEERREKLLGLLDRELVWPFRAERIER